MAEENIYKGQTKLIINVEVDSDITGSTVKIQYKKPSGNLGFFPGTILDALLGLIKYQVLSASDLDEIGKWCFWAEVTYSDGKIIYGDPKIKIVNEVGNCSS